MEFPCPHCDYVLRTPDDKAGMSANCPACGASIWVPFPHELASNPVAAEAIDQPPRAAEGAASAGADPSAGNASMKHCFECGAQIRAAAEICPHCGVRQATPAGTQSAAAEDPAVQAFAGNKLAAGLCGILLGYLGIHKFILGLTTPGIIMLLASLATCGIAVPVMWLIGVIEGVLYLTKSDEDFYRDYAVNQKEWF